MTNKEPREIITDWCEFHLDEVISRWPASSSTHRDARVASNGYVYAGDGIIAALAVAGYKIVPA